MSSVFDEEIETFLDAADELRQTWHEEADTPGGRFHLLAADLFDQCASALRSAGPACRLMTRERIALEMAKCELGVDR